MRSICTCKLTGKEMVDSIPSWLSIQLLLLLLLLLVWCSSRSTTSLCWRHVFQADSSKPVYLLQHLQHKSTPQYFTKL